MTTYSRTCPRCNSTFHAVSERGICPTCNLASLIRPDGSYVATRVMFTALDGDEPLCDGPLSNVYAAAAYGGAPLVESFRFEGFPTPEVCHGELRREFHRLKTLLESEIPDALFARITQPSSHSDWIGSAFEHAIELRTITWNDENDQVDLVCCLTENGGMIGVLRNGKMEIGSEHTNEPTVAPDYD